MWSGPDQVGGGARPDHHQPLLFDLQDRRSGLGALPPCSATPSAHHGNIVLSPGPRSCQLEPCAGREAEAMTVKSQVMSSYLVKP